MVRDRLPSRSEPRARVGLRLLCRPDSLSGNSRGRTVGSSIFPTRVRRAAFLKLRSSCVAGAVPRRSEWYAGASALLMVLGAGLFSRVCVCSSPRRPRRQSTTVSGRVRDQVLAPVHLGGVPQRVGRSGACSGRASTPQICGARWARSSAPLLRVRAAGKARAVDGGGPDPDPPLLRRVAREHRAPLARRRGRSAPRGPEEEDQDAAALPHPPVASSFPIMHDSVGNHTLLTITAHHGSNHPPTQRRLSMPPPFTRGSYKTVFRKSNVDE